jgi:hypothetical protein
MEELKLREVPIEYSRQLGTYYYSSYYLMKIQMDFRPLTEDDLRKYDGGSISLYDVQNYFKISA